MTKAQRKRIINQVAKIKSRTYRPSGKTDNGGRWYPSTGEKRECCNLIREPSRAFPWSLYKHCNSVKHIANDPELLEAVHELESNPDNSVLWYSTKPKHSVQYLVGGVALGQLKA